MIPEETIQKHLNKISKLHQYRNKTEQELYKIAKERAELHDPELEIDFLTDRKEQKVAKELVRRYIKDYLIETVSDKNLIKHIVFLEIIQSRMQSSMNDIHKANKALPLNMAEGVQKNLDAILKAKQALGLTRDKRDAQRDDATRAWDKLKLKAKKWREQNQGSRTLICPHCSQMVLLKIRMEMWEAQKHPFFKDRVLGNLHLLALYQQRTITADDVAKILGTSEDYVEWLIEKWNLGVKDSNGEEGKEETEEVPTDTSGKAQGEGQETVTGSESGES